MKEAELKSKYLRLFDENNEFLGILENSNGLVSPKRLISIEILITKEEFLEFRNEEERRDYFKICTVERRYWFSGSSNSFANRKY